MISQQKDISFELLRVLLVGLVIGISGGLAANLFVLAVLQIDDFVRSDLVSLKILGFDVARWLALVAAAMLIIGLKRTILHADSESTVGT